MINKTLKPKIVLFSRSLNLGGAEKQSLLLAEELSKTYDTTLIVLYKEGDLLNQIDETKKMFFFPNGNIFNKSIQIYSYFKQNKTNILINYLPVNNILGSILGMLAGVDNIYIGIRGTKLKANYFKRRIQYYISHKIAAGIISNSFKAKEVYTNYGYNPGKFYTIHNGIDTLNKYIKKNASDEINIISVGRFVNEKDYHTAIKSMKVLNEILEDKSVKWQYTIIGYGNLKEELSKTIKDFGLEDKIKLVDGRSNIDQYYRSASIYLSTSIHEGMSNTIMEAMSFSLPIIATKAGDVQYLVNHKKNGFQCDIGDYNSIAQALLELIKSKKLRNNMGVESYNKIIEEFSVQRMVSNYKSLLNL